MTIVKTADARHVRSSKALPATSDKDESPDEEEWISDRSRAIRVIVGQGFGLSWPVNAVHSVLLLTGTEVPSKSA